MIIGTTALNTGLTLLTEDNILFESMQSLCGKVRHTNPINYKKRIEDIKMKAKHNIR